MRPCCGLRHARDQRPVDLARRTRAEGLGERRGGKPGLRHQQAAGGILVEPVHQPRALAVGVAQHVEHAIEMARGAGAALHREPHGLVEHQHVVVLVERDRFEEFAGLGLGLAAGRARLGLLEPQRRDAHRLPGLEPLLWLRALAVHAQLALADDALDVGERQPGKARLEEAVDAHAGFVARSPWRSARRFDGGARSAAADVAAALVSPPCSWTPPQFFRRRAGPIEQELFASHPQRDGDVADGAFAPAARADVPGTAHPVARSHDAGAIAPLQGRAN